jgi:hypothetical protein
MNTEAGKIAADAAKAGWEKVLEVSSTADLLANHHGQPLAVGMRNGDGALAFKGSVSTVSRRSAPARAGEIFRATTVIRAEGPDELVPAHFGPMFVDANNEIVFHWVTIPIASLNTDQPVEVEVKAPAGTMAVRLRLVGGWADGKDSRNMTYTYGPAVLYRKTA